MNAVLVRALQHGEIDYHRPNRVVIGEHGYYDFLLKGRLDVRHRRQTLNILDNSRTSVTRRNIMMGGNDVRNHGASHAEPMIAIFMRSLV